MIRACQMPYRPRAERDVERVRAAALAAQAVRGSAIDCALAQIAAAFGEAAAINAFKLRLDEWLRLGPRHPAVRARFRARAEMIAGCPLDAAIARVERWWRDERRAFQIARAFGHGNRLSLEVLREMRLILRLLRRKGLHAEFGPQLAALCGELMAEAAE
jgi:hypothetical protein